MRFKDSLRDLVAGDKAVYVIKDYMGYMQNAYVVDVIRVTKTQIRASTPWKGDDREASFFKETGVKFGDSVRYSYPDTLVVGKDAEEELREGQEANLRKTLGGKLDEIATKLRNDRKYNLSEVLDIIERCAAMIKVHLNTEGAA